jgi:hypothetical protein
MVKDSFCYADQSDAYDVLIDMILKQTVLIK